MREQERCGEEVGSSVRVLAKGKEKSKGKACVNICY